MEAPIPLQILPLPGSEDLPLPRYQSEGASGLDLHAAVRESLTILPGTWQLVPTGIAVALPQGYEAQVRPRSGLALRHGIGVLNAPGTVDSDYRGEIGVILFNFSKRPFTVSRGDRIAQLVVSQVQRVRVDAVSRLPETRRGSGGFGHTGQGGP